MKIAVLPGDGIGPEIIAQAVKVLDVLRRDGLKFELETAPVGGAAYDAHGHPLPEATLQAGAGGRRGAVRRGRRLEVRHAAARMRPEQAHPAACARSCGLFANLRPAICIPNWSAHRR